ILGADLVGHASAQEIDEEVGFLEVKHAVVVTDRLATHRVMDDDGVVAEPLPVDLARPDGEQADLKGRCTGRSRVGGLRQRAAANEQETGKRSQRQQPAHASWIRTASCCRRRLSPLVTRNMKPPNW